MSRLALPAALVLGALARWFQHSQWYQDGRFLYAGKPILASLDGYYYLDLARSGDWTSGLAALLALPVGLSPEAWAVLLPVVLGPLLAIPVYLWGRELTGSAWAGCVAATLAILLPCYLLRSGAGRADTDLLNATLTLGLAWACYRRRWFTALVLWAAFLWWWDLARLPVTLLFLAPLTLASARGLWENMNPAPATLWLGVAVVAFAQWVDFSGILAYSAGLSASGTALPPMNVAEMGPTGLGQWSIAAGHWTVLVLALGGLVLMARQWRAAAFLVAPAGLCLMALGANRFLLFAAPLLGLGIATALHRLPAWPSRLAGAALVAWAFLTAAAVGPVRPARLVEAFTWLRQVPEDSLIVADWGHGHPIRWYANREPFDDGRRHGRRKLWQASVPLAMESPYEAAQWIRTELADSSPRPVYLLVDRMKVTTGWWKYGTWDPERGRGREPGDWINRTVMARLLTQPTAEGFGLVFDNGFARVWKVVL